MLCTNCGTENPMGAAFCGNCGTAMAAGPIPPIPPTPPAPGPFTPAAPPPEEKKKSKAGLWIGLVVLLVVGAIVGTYLVIGGGDDEGSEEIVLEPIGSRVEDDFAGDLDLAGFEDSIDKVLPELPPLEDGVASVLSAHTADGDTPGLYGGSRDVGTCDISTLVDFLTDDDNAEKAEAWAEVQGIDVDEIGDFIDDLTPVRLRYDTRVTNHGFTDGAANAFQSVLEAGTAVMVDDRGVPRVKCNCGNPLAEPVEFDGDEDESLDEDIIQNPDDAWDDFDPDLVVVIIAGDRLDDFTLVDIDTAELYNRPVGTDGDEDGDVDPDEVCEVFADSPTCDEAPPDDDDDDDDPPEDTTTTTIVLGTGDVQVTLRWGSNADLDLAVTDPTGEEIDFVNSGPTASGGELDVDSNIQCPADADSGVENIFWPPGGAPSGDYTVTVTGFAGSVDTGDCGGGAYELTIAVAGQPDQVIDDSVADGEVDTFNFSVG